LLAVTEGFGVGVCVSSISETRAPAASSTDQFDNWRSR